MIRARAAFIFMVTLAMLSGCSTPFGPTPKVYRVGWISANSEAQSTLTDVLRQALRDVGYVEGRNLVLEARYTEGHEDRYAGIAAEFAASKPDVVVVRPAVGAIAMKQATSTVPIVLAGGGNDPVADGLVTSLSKPGGNVTGAINAGPELAQRRLQLLKEAIPGASRIAFVFESAANSQRTYQESRSVATALGVDLVPFEVRSVGDLGAVLAAVARSGADAILVSTGSGAAGFISQQQQILDVVAASHLPSMFATNRTYADRGGLMFYDQNEVDAVRSAATYVDRILKGAKPSDLPIAKPTKFDLIINLKTAKSLGLTIPKSVLDQATEVIQ